MWFLAAAHNQARTEEVRHKKATAIEAVELRLIQFAGRSRSRYLPARPIGPMPGSTNRRIVAACESWRRNALISR